MNRSFNQFQSQFHYYGQAQTTRAYASQQQPDDPHDDTDDGDEEGEKGEGKAQEKAQWPAISICVAHDYEFPLFLFQSLSFVFLK